MNKQELKDHIQTLRKSVPKDDFGSAMSIAYGNVLDYLDTECEPESDIAARLRELREVISKQENPSDMALAYASLLEQLAPVVEEFSRQASMVGKRHVSEYRLRFDIGPRLYRIQKLGMGYVFSLYGRLIDILDQCVQAGFPNDSKAACVICGQPVAPGATSHCAECLAKPLKD